MKLNQKTMIKSEVQSMKTRTVATNVLVSSLDVVGAIGVNVLSSCLLT
jgi:hypothetical protein